MLGELQDSLLEDISVEDVKAKLDLMIKYCGEHFVTEETLMEPYQTDMPSYGRHVEQHTEFVLATHEFYEKFRAEGKKVAWDMFAFLGTCLGEHTKGTDRAMRDEYRALGAT